MSIPIIGQMHIGEDWFLTLPVHCSCGEVFLLAGQVGVTRACPKCRKAHRLMKLPAQGRDPITGAITDEVIWSIGTPAGGLT